MFQEQLAEDICLLNNLLICTRQVSFGDRNVQGHDYSAPHWHIGKIVDPFRPISDWERRLVKVSSYPYKKMMNKTKGHLSQYQIRVDYQVHRIMSFSARVIRFCGLLHENNKNPKEVSLFVRLQGADLEMEGKQSVIFVFEECNGGTLEDKIKKEPMMNKASIFKYILQIVEGLNDLRKKGILHRNLLPCNIMLHEDQLKFIGFDSAFILHVSESDSAIEGLRRQTDMPQEIRELIATPQQLLQLMSSEMLYRRQQKCDIYYLGMIIFKLILHKDYQHYYEDSSVLSLLVQDHNNVQCDPRILQLMQGCLKADPKVRFSLEKVNEVLREIELQRYFEEDSEQQMYLVEEPLNACNLATNELAFFQKQGLFPNVSSIRNPKEELDNKFEEALQQGIRIRHTDRYLECVRVQLQHKQIQNVFRYAEERVLAQRKLKNLTEKLLKMLNIRAYYYEYLFRLINWVDVKQIMDSVQKENIANHIAAISEQLVTLLAFVYELITKCPFRSDSAYRQEDYCYESRLLMRKMDSNYRRKRFFEGRVKTVRRNRRGTSELEKAIDKFHQIKYSEEERDNFDCEYINIKEVFGRLDTIIKGDLKQSIVGLIMTRDNSINCTESSYLNEILIMLILLESQDLLRLRKHEIVLIKNSFARIYSDKLTMDPQQINAFFEHYKSTHTKEVHRNLNSQKQIVKSRILSKSFLNFFADDNSRPQNDSQLQVSD